MYDCCWFQPFSFFSPRSSWESQLKSTLCGVAFFGPRTSLNVDLNDSLTVCHFSLMVSTPNSSSKTWNLFKSTVLNSCCLVVSLSCIEVSYCRRWQLSPVQFLFSLSFSLAIRRWWSEATSTSCFTQTSWRDLLKFLPMHTWYIWFSVDRSGDTQVAFFDGRQSLQ